jgi:flavorubredoxin
MPVELYDKHGHKCLMFTDLNGPGTAAVQSNQFLIVDDDTGALIDPGGNLAYHELYVGMSRISRRRAFPPSSPRTPIPTSSDRSIAG